MTERDRDELLFDSLLKAGTQIAFQNEMDSLPSVDELNEQYTPSSGMDTIIGKSIRRTIKKSGNSRIRTNMLRIACGLSIFLVISGGVLMSVEAARNAILNAVLDWQDQYTRISFEETAPGESVEGIYYPSYLPEGFTEKEREVLGKVIVITFHDELKNEIIMVQRPAETGSLSVDNEQRKFSQIQVAGAPAFLFAAESNIQSMLIWEKQGTAFEIISMLSTEELIKVAESVKR